MSFLQGLESGVGIEDHLGSFRVEGRRVEVQGCIYTFSPPPLARTERTLSPPSCYLGFLAEAWSFIPHHFPQAPSLSPVRCSP